MTVYRTTVLTVSVFFLVACATNNIVDTPEFKNLYRAYASIESTRPETNFPGIVPIYRPEKLPKPRMYTRVPTAIKTVKPIYPVAASVRHAQGTVCFIFDVNNDGYIRNLRISKTTKTRLFDSAAIEAIIQWQFEPLAEGGSEIERTDAYYCFEFILP